MMIIGKFSPILYKNICCGFSIEEPQQGASEEDPQDMLLWRNKKNYPRIIAKYSSLRSPMDYSFHEITLNETIIPHATARK